MSLGFTHWLRALLILMPVQMAWAANDCDPPTPQHELTLWTGVRVVKAGELVRLWPHWERAGDERIVPVPSGCEVRFITDDPVQITRQADGSVNWVAAAPRDAPLRLTARQGKAEARAMLRIKAANDPLHDLLGVWMLDRAKCKDENLSLCREIKGGEMVFRGDGQAYFTFTKLFETWIDLRTPYQVVGRRILIDGKGLLALPTAAEAPCLELSDTGQLRAATVFRHVGQQYLPILPPGMKSYADLYASEAGACVLPFKRLSFPESDARHYLY